MSLHFSTLLSARLTWDSRVRELLDDIKEKIKSTVGYMADNMRDDLMNREFRKVRFLDLMIPTKFLLFTVILAFSFDVVQCVEPWHISNLLSEM